MMVPLIAKINEPLELNKAESEVEDTTYDETDLNHFHMATGIDLEKFVPKEHLDNLNEDNLGDIMEAAGIGAPDMDKMIMMGWKFRYSVQK